MPPFERLVLLAAFLSLAGVSANTWAAAKPSTASKAAAAQSAPPAQNNRLFRIGAPETLVPETVTANRSFWGRVSAVTSPYRPLRYKEFGLEVGWQRSFLAVDARFRWASAQAGMLSVEPNFSENFGDFASALEPDSELNRPRSNSDPWSLWLVEPGVSVSGKVFPDFLPLLSQYGRFGIGYGTFNDQLNAIGFAALTFSFEGGIRYQLGGGSPWTVEFSAAYNFGTINSRALESAQLGRIPVSWVTSSLGLLYWF